MKINIQERYYFLFHALFLFVFVFSLLSLIKNVPDNNFFQAGLFSLSKEESIREQTIEEPEIKIFQMQVQKGEGLTHLARRALIEYSSDIELNNEQKIYIEDFIQKRLDQIDLYPGDIVSIPEDLIEQGINQALQLQEHELENLKQYSQLVFK
ncbi:MAG: hypothetical protein PHN37_01965 [Candidatus Pacebacteria bacterium]|nr:hypothetical protein [Candidatus Paceibacterota bacterium]